MLISFLLILSSHLFKQPNSSGKVIESFDQPTAQETQESQESDRPKE